MRRTFFVAAILGLLAGGGFGRSTAASRQAASSILRFHHAHYRVGDPSAAMNDAARKLEGVRVIVPGLGVGVREGREYLLFDRSVAAEPPAAGRSAAAAYPHAVEQLKAWGFHAEPPDVNRLRVAAAMGELPVDHLAFVADDFPAVVQRIVSTGMRPAVQRDDSVLFDEGEGPAIEIVRDTDRAETFWCPMHPDVRSSDEGKCPACGMALVPIPPPRIGEYRLDVSQVIESGRLAGLTLAVREPDTHALVKQFAIVHEKLVHLFVVSRDLTYFAHVHPDLRTDGTLSLAHSLPPGEYMLIADFVPVGGTAQMVQKAIIVGGKGGPARTPEERNGLRVSLQTEDFAAGKHARLTFTVTDETTGAPVTDLEPYLGAPAHLLIVRDDLTDAIHGHPEEHTSAGPAVTFHPIIPARGRYKLWVQFQRRGQVSTTSFELTADR